MLKIFDKDHNAIGHIVKYRDCRIESEVATGDKTLSFVYLGKYHSLENEMYVQTKEDEYVIKEVPASTDAFPQIVAVLNLEDLQKDMWQSFSVTDATIDEAARTLLAGTGWTIGSCDVTKRRNAGMMQVSSLDAIQKLCTAFMCEPVFDTLSKTVSFYEQRGEDKGMYFMSGLNLRKLQKKSTSYDYYTRMIPLGEDGLTIESVNDGKNYLENFQYSNKILTLIWKDESYTDPEALMEDAVKKLEDLSRPEVAYSVEVRDLAAQKPEYSVLSYGEGDTVKLIDQSTGTMVTQRIKKLVRYPDDPEKNTCEIANTILTFEEMQQKYQDAADIINYTVTGDGRYTGKISVSDILKFEEGLAGSSTIGGINSDISTMEGEIAQVKLTLGELDVNYLSVDEADAKYAAIDRAEMIEADINKLDADYADFKSMTTEELAAQRALVENITAGEVTTDYLEANYAKMDLSNIELGCITNAMLGTGIVETAQIADGAITDAKIVELTANKITAGTLSVERLEIRGSENSLVYALNNITGALQTQNVDTLNGEILTERSIAADKIVANSISGNEIAAQTITANNIVAGSITGNELAANAITTEKLAANAVTAAKINSKAITTEKLATDAIKSLNYVYSSGNFSTAGTFLDLEKGLIRSKNFAIDEAGNAYFSGTLSGASGTFSGTLSGAEGDFTGTITATALTATNSGQIGPWYFNGTSIYKGSSAYGSSTSGAMYFGNSGLSINSNFKVNSSGILTVNGAVVNGSITATNLTVYDTVYLYNSALKITQPVLQLASDSVLYIGGTQSDMYFTITQIWGTLIASSQIQANILYADSHVWSQGLIYENGTSLTSQYMKYTTANGYPGLNVNGNTSTWIRTTVNGFIPYQSGGAGSGHCSIGTSTWYFSKSYIDYMYCVTTTAQGIELSAATPHIDFHHASSTADWTSRIITHSDGLLLIGKSGYSVCVGSGLSSGTYTFGPRNNSGAALDGKMYLGGAANRWYWIYSSSGSVHTSDVRDKNISELDDRYIEFFMKLKPIKYTWKDTSMDETVHIGLAAQPTEETAYECGLTNDELGAIVHDYWIIPDEDGRTDRYSMQYEEILMLAVPFVQQHELTLTDHAAKLTALRTQFTTTETKLASIQQQLQQMNERLDRLGVGA